MTLVPGTSLGAYDIVALIGAGGMGEVYRARDPKLDRDVAIKVLPDMVAHDPERLARFEREAKTLAALNHPNIAHIHGFEDSTGVPALVMELVEGPTLADRIGKGPIPIDEALPIAKQIAEALEAAHEQGIIHRDLKPANIKVKPDGTVKLLDFGLAKAFDPRVPANGSASMSPTLSIHATQAGIILGTAAYMAPEQARGKPVDKRADIWAFGCVLFEMLSGRRAFDGDDVSITLASVLKTDPDWTALPAATPATLPVYLRRCLEKDPKDRLRDIGDVRLALNGAFDLRAQQPSESVVAKPNSLLTGRSLLLIIGGALAGAVAVSAVVVWNGSTLIRPAESAKTIFEIATPGNNFNSQFDISPDGRQLVARIDDEGLSRLWMRPFDRVSGVVLRGTDGASYPFWSGDSRYVGFFADGKLKKIDTSGVVAQTLAVVGIPRGGTWSRDGVILYAPTADSPLFRVSSSGGPAVQVTELDRARGETSHRFPRFLPDSDHFLYLSVNMKEEASAICVGSLASKTTKQLVPSVVRGAFAPPDLLLFVSDTTLMAQRLDLRRFEMLGDAYQVVEHVGANAVNSLSGFAVSNTGVLAYRKRMTSNRQLSWIDRDGKLEGTVGNTAPGYENPRLSPDGRRLAIYKPENGGDIWIMDLERSSSTRFTFNPATDNNPVWSPDGTRIAFVSNRDGGIFNVYVKNAAGTSGDELLLKTSHNKLLDDWSPDGRYILYQEFNPKTQWDLWLLPLTGDRKPVPLLASPFNERSGAFSPDGHWLAYQSDETGERGIGHVFVRSFPLSGGQWQISTTQFGSAPRWNPNGRELFYDAAGPMMAVDLTGTVPGGAFNTGRPRQLFQGLLNLPPHNYDVAPDGRRFLVISEENASSGLAPLVVELNWTARLKP